MLQIELNNDRKKFLNNVAYFKNENNYCLGSNLNEAGNIIIMIGQNKNIKAALTIGKAV